MFQAFLAACGYFLAALILALLEIEIEGKNGWASKLPTWRFRRYTDENNLQKKGKRALTGYHVFLNLLILLFFHLPFFDGQPWSDKAELVLWSRWFLFLPVWDFLWFVFNPAYGLKNFRREKIFWHSEVKWPLNLAPIEYFYGLGGSLFFAWIISRFGDYNSLLFDLYFLLLTALACLFGKPYRRFRQKLYQKTDL